MLHNKKLKNGDINLLSQSNKIDNVMKISDPYTIFAINNSIDKIIYNK